MLTAHWPAEWTEFLKTQIFKGLGVPKELLQNRGVPTVLTPEQKRTRRGFLREIRANPEDDTPRLIFADWLEDNGDPNHATLIRVQCERASKGLTECVNVGGSQRLVFLCEGADWTKRNARRCEYCRLTAEQDRVLWTWATYSTLGIRRSKHCHWERGFVAEVKDFDFDWWHRWGPRICQEHPVERVGLDGVEQCVHGGRIRNVDEWFSSFRSFPEWFLNFYQTVKPPTRKSQDEATDHINNILLDWAKCEARKLDEIEDAKEND